jgi:hypothetical protein
LVGPRDLKLKYSFSDGKYVSVIQVEIWNAFSRKRFMDRHLGFTKLLGQNFTSSALAIWLSLRKMQTES